MSKIRRNKFWLRCCRESQKSLRIAVLPRQLPLCRGSAQKNIGVALIEFTLYIRNFFGGQLLNSPQLKTGNFAGTCKFCCTGGHFSEQQGMITSRWGYLWKRQSTAVNAMLQTRTWGPSYSKYLLSHTAHFNRRRQHVGCHQKFR